MTQKNEKLSLWFLEFVSGADSQTRTFAALRAADFTTVVAWCLATMVAGRGCASTVRSTMTTMAAGASETSEGKGAYS